MKSSKIAAAILTALVASACTQKPTPKATELVAIDQCGYVTGTEKMAFISVEAKEFRLIDANGNSVMVGNVGAPQYWAESGDSVRTIDFTDINAEGTYQIVVDDTIASYPFVIAAHPYAELARMSVRAYYYNRTATAIDAEHGGKWVRNAGHPDTLVKVHSSAASKARPEGTIISSPRGWYDAGDYNKYVVNSGITTYTMLLAANQMKEMAAKTDLNIPESGDSIADILDETLYNLRWMMTMQDPNDGGVYHKLTTLSFEGFIMPDECKNQRYVVAKGTAAALDFAATMAYAARTLPEHSASLSSLADSCRQQAAAAYAWAVKNPNVAFRNPAGVSTGEYGDRFFGDEWFWASVEMYLLTGEDSYKETALANLAPMAVPSWGYVNALGYYSLALSDKEIEGLDAKGAVVAAADSLIAEAKKSPVALSMTRYEWGSNSTVANMGMLKLIAGMISTDKKYYESALDDLHYILGRNATGYCFVTGAGSKPCMNIHHRPSAADNIEEPIPGFLCGGPNTSVPTDCGPTNTRSQYPAKAYSDETCSYSTNEIAINWNAPLTFLVWGIENAK